MTDKRDWFIGMSKDEREVVIRLTEVVIASIHREVCEPYVGGDHEPGGAHLPCEWNMRHGLAVWEAKDVTELRSLLMVYRPVYEIVREKAAMLLPREGNTGSSK